MTTFTATGALGVVNTGVITAGGTLGILIPPSVMIIVYAAVAGQSVVKLYAAAMFPGFAYVAPKFESPTCENPVNGAHLYHENNMIAKMIATYYMSNP